MKTELKSIFIDTNILLDVFMQRTNFFHASLHVWQLCEMQLVKGYVSAISFNNIHYILMKHNSRKNADHAMALLLDSFLVVPVDERILRLAAGMPGADFEDAIQIHSARQCNAQAIITRDSQHFADSQLLCLTPAQFLAARTLAHREN